MIIEKCIVIIILCGTLINGQSETSKVTFSLDGAIKEENTTPIDDERLEFRFKCSEKRKYTIVQI